MEKYITIVCAGIASFVSFLVGGLGMSVTVLIALMAIDFLTGVMAAYYLNKANSRVGFKGLMRKCYYLFMLSGVYMIGFVVDGVSYAADGLVIALCIMELVSIIENGNKMGIILPEQVQRLLALLGKGINEEYKKGGKK